MGNIRDISDENLVNLVCTKDQELYHEIVRRYQGKLLRYITYLTQSESRAADISQEVFIKAFINLRGFNIKKKFSSWIYRIAHNETINYLKKHRREISLEDHPVKDLLSTDVGAQEGFDQEDLKKSVAACLDQLPMIYRSPLTLFYIEEYSYEEISDILRIPIGTIGTQIRRGKKLLAEICSKEEGLKEYA